jgi:6-phosphofructokinase 1
VTDFCYLAEGLRTRTLFAAHRQLLLTAVPVDISGALTCDLCEVSVGFDTASRLAAQVAGNNATDAASAKKYYYFQRLPGRSLVALEVALATHPNYVLLSEEVEARGWSLADITGSIADCICARAAVGKNYGTVLVPTGLLESSAELHSLCRELGAMQADGWQSGVPTATHTTQGTLGTEPQSEADARHPPLTTPVEAVARLTPWSRALFLSFPELAQRQLLADRNLHTIDLPQVTRAPVHTTTLHPTSTLTFALTLTLCATLTLSHQVEAEKLLLALVEAELKRRTREGTYGGSFSGVASSISYQAAGATPSNFDVTLAYNLGHTAVAITRAGYRYVLVSNMNSRPIHLPPNNSHLSHSLSILHGHGW